METIILWIVIIAVGAVWERIKKKADKDEQWRPPGTSPLPAPCDAPWAQPHTKATAKPQRQAQSGTAAAAPKPKQASLPHAYKPIKDTTPDNVMEIETLDEDNGTITAGSKMTDQDIRARQAHYDRWRKAILDTQILERKF